MAQQSSTVPSQLYLYKLTPARLGMVTTGPTEQEKAIMEEHFAYLKKLTDDGIMLLVGRTGSAHHFQFVSSTYLRAT